MKVICCINKCLHFNGTLGYLQCKSSWWSVILEKLYIQTIIFLDFTDQFHCILCVD